MQPVFAPSSRVCQGGWNLAELSVVVAVAGLLASAAVWSVSAGKRQQTEMIDQSRALEIQSAVVAFAIRNARLPCPDVNGDGREGDASSTCPVSAQSGWIPYETLGLTAPAPDARGAYLVWRDASQNADLTQRAERTGDTATSDGYMDRADLLAGLRRASQVGVSASHPYMTGDGAAMGVEDCVLPAATPAFALILPGGDRDADGSAFDGVHGDDPTSMLCMAASSRTASATFDDQVVAMSFSVLAGLIEQAHP